MYKLIDGKAHSRCLREQIADEVKEYKRSLGRDIGLAVVLVGNDGASQVYVRNKIKACEEVGIKSFAYYLPETASEQEVEELVCELAENDAVHGILVQLPLWKRQLKMMRFTAYLFSCRFQRGSMPKKFYLLSL